MRLPIRFRPEAEEDLRLAIEWYEEQRAGLGGELLDDVGETMERIARLPESYRLVDGEFRRALLRQFPYAIYFRVRSSIEVFAIFHARRRRDR
ncbi:MAG: type II toxin-antitoxin system RelE/ParE family toxin [Polyangiales bacterium]